MSRGEDPLTTAIIDNQAAERMGWDEWENASEKAIMEARQATRDEHNGRITHRLETLDDHTDATR